MMSIFCHDIQMPVKVNMGTLGRDVATKLVPVDEILSDSDPFILFKHNVLCQLGNLLAHFSECYEFVSLMGHFVDVFVLKCFNGGRYSMEPKILLSISFPRNEKHIFNVLSEIHWRIGPYIALRKENPLWLGCGLCIGGHKNLRSSRPVTDCMVTFLHLTQEPLERYLHIYAGQANAGPVLIAPSLGFVH